MIKKLLFTSILVLFACSITLAGHFIQKFTPDVTDMCSSCPDAAAGADICCEDFEGTGYVCSNWDAYFDVDPDNTPTGSWTCNETNSQNLEVLFEEYDRLTRYLHNTSPTYAVWYFKVTAESLNNGGYTYIGVGRDQDDSLYVYFFRMEQDSSGNLFFSISQRNDSNGYTNKTVGSGPTFYTLGDEVRVRVAHDATAGSGTSTWYVKVGSASEDTIAFTEDETDDNEHFGHVQFGYQDTQTDYTIEYDFIRFDDDTMPAACSGDSY
jgi:hypothetical protein